MEAPRRYSVSPYYSFVTVPTRRVPSFGESLKAIWRWWRPRPVPLRQMFVEAKLVAEIAAEFEEAEAEPPVSVPKVNAKRAGRRTWAEALSPRRRSQLRPFRPRLR
jgi:hypothetical protein